MMLERCLGLSVVLLAQLAPHCWGAPPAFVRGCSSGGMWSCEPDYCEVITPPFYSLPSSNFYPSVPALTTRSEPSNDDLYDAIRRAARSAVIRSFNSMGSRHDAGPPRDARLLESLSHGIEDAIVDGFNSIRVPAASDSRAEPQPPPQQQLPEELAPPVPTPDSTSEVASPSANGLEHVPTHLLTESFWAQYTSAQLESAGWLVRQGQVQVLPIRGEFVVLNIRSEPELVDIWKSKRLIAERVRFSRYFEDANRLARQD